MEKVLRTKEDTKDLAKEILQKIQETKKDTATVLGLYGNLGAGKTTLTQCIADELSVKERVLSPTFVIMKIYQIDFVGFKNLVHIDAYRIENIKEILHLGFEEIIKNKENLVIVEWPERIIDVMPEHIKVKMEIVTEDERKVLVE
jgi:tRNA threonylcarbamoyladenosine biosynthesis protein TsaE